IDEKRYQNPPLAQQVDDFLKRVAVRDDIQPPFRRQLLPPFRNQRHHLRLDFERDPGHLFGGGHLQVELRPDRLTEDLQVPVLNVTAVFTKMDDDAVGPRQLGKHRRGDWIGLLGLSRLAQRRNMIDIDPEPCHMRLTLKSRFTGWKSGYYYRNGEEGQGLFGGFRPSGEAAEGKIGPF